jgi:hypothetical protein
MMYPFTVIPAKAGTHKHRAALLWVPAFAGMTVFFGNDVHVS